MKIIKILGIAIGAAAVGLAGLAVMNPANVADTSAESEDENLRPRSYKTSLETFAAETEKIIPMLSTYGQSWRFIESKTEDTSAVIKAEVPVVMFTDDLEIKAEKDTEKEEIIVNVHSASRVGKSDLGENRRHVLQILNALDEKFSEK